MNIKNLRESALALVDDRIPARAGELQMAMDEVLLEHAAGTTLRCYTWDTPTVSFGYFLRFNDLDGLIPAGMACVRRWTGGGVVRHGTDFTFSLCCPAAHPLAGLRPLESYRQIHEAIVIALRKSGIGATLATGESGAGQSCFQRPVACDVLWQGKKVAGGAQRRTRVGLLHQGSIQGIDLPPEFAANFAGALADKVADAGISAELRVKAATLAAEKYGTAAWLRLR